MKEIYISTDIEADGPIPGPHSMLSTGSAAYTADKVLVSTFSATLPDAQPHPKTAEWWAKQPDAWAACRKDLEPPEFAMKRYVAWIKTLEGKPVFVAYPAGFDFMFDGSPYYRTVNGASHILTHASARYTVLLN